MLGLDNQNFTNFTIISSLLFVILSPQSYLATTKTEREKAQAIIKSNPRTSQEYVSRAGAYYILGSIKKQIDDFTSAIRISPTDANLYEKRAKAFYTLGELRKVINDANKARELDPRLSDPYWLAAAAHDELGLFDEALKLRTKITKLEANNAYAWSARAKLYESMGKFELAQADWLMAFKLAGPIDRVEMQLNSPLINSNSPSIETLKNNLKEQLKKGSVILQLHYDREGHICVPVQVNGHDFQFMLDTGCENSELWNKALHGVATKDKLLLQRRNANGSKHLSGWFRARNLRLGGLSLPNVVLELNDGLNDRSNLSGFLGGNILENFMVTVDYSKKQLRLANSIKQNRRKQAIVVPMILRNHRPYCNVKIDGKVDVMALLDTGSPFSMSPETLVEPILKRHLKFNSIISGMSFGNLFTEVVQTENLQIGSLLVNGPIFEIFPASDAPGMANWIVLGNPFLSRFKTVTFDYPARQIILEPNNSITESAPNSYIEGQFYFRHNRPKQAINAFQKSMKLDSELATICYDGTANVYLDQKENLKALKEITKAINLDPKVATLYLTRARIYENLGKHSLQIADLTTAIHIDSSNQIAYLSRANVYDKLHKHKLAERDRRKSDQLYEEWSKKHH